MESILATNEYVGISFWLATAIMLASTVFFFVERSDVKGKWKTSMTVAGLVTGVAFWHYLYMREVWVVMGDTPTVYRYIDWLITVPLQIIEFYLVIAAVTAISAAIFWKLLIASIVMLVFGYLGETGLMNVTVGFVIGMVAWLYIIYLVTGLHSEEIFNISFLQIFILAGGVLLLFLLATMTRPTIWFGKRFK